MRAVFSDEADRDFELIGDSIAEDNPTRAVTFLKELRIACAGLVETPLRFAELESFEHLGWRRRFHGRYALIYVVDQNELTILRVLSLALAMKSALDPN
jgi:plasmid stabilization system protein ParE